jgi:hypothetical protein
MGAGCMPELYIFRHLCHHTQMACIVCDHGKRFRIETAIKQGKPKARIAKEFGIARQTLQDHIRAEHNLTNPVKEPEGPEAPDPPDPVPNDNYVRGMMSRADRVQHVDRLLSDRRFYGSETIAKLSRLWRDYLGKDAERQVSEMFAEAFKRRVISGGSKDLRKKFAMAELLSLYRECRESGDRKTALSAFERYIELDNLKDNPTLDRAVLVQIVQLIKHEAPHLERRVEEHLAQFEIVVDQAKAVLEGEILPETKALPAKEEPIPEAPPTPRSSAGIDTGIPSSEEPSSE